MTTPNKKLACIILAAGKGTRMKSATPKPLHGVAGLPMVNHVVNAALGLSPDKIVVVIGPDMPEMASAVAPHTTCIQTVVNGTGGAVLAAREQFTNFDGDILIIYGDMPLMTTATMKRMIDIRRQFPAIGLTFSGMRVDNPGSYGRMVLDDDGTLKKIVEFKDANDDEKKITLCNGGVVCADGARLFDWLSQIGNDNAQKEYYLTDLPQIARKDNRTTHVVEIDATEMAGANNRVELAQLELLMQTRLRNQHMLGGATLIDPASVFFAHDTIIGQDVTIEPNVFFGAGVTVGNNVTIHAHSHIAGATIDDGAEVGPFARLRTGTKLGKDAVIGNFVETKNTSFATGAKAKHLTYLGDTEVGEKANIGAGTITCNYDGFMKYKTIIGKEAFVGSNSLLLAPLHIGNGAFVGAGSAISEDVPDNALGISRAPQITKEGWATEFKRKKMVEKAKKK